MTIIHKEDIEDNQQSPGSNIRNAPKEAERNYQVKGNNTVNKSERMKKLKEELLALEQNSSTLDEDQLEQLLFRMNNIGYSLKRIADSLGDIKRMMAEDRSEL